MAIIKVTRGGKTSGSLKKIMEYINKENDFLGKDLSDNMKHALREMQMTKELYLKTDGRQYAHYVMAFKPNEVDKERAKKIALEFAEENFKGFEVAIGTHTDKEHIHCHLIVNSVNFETGRKFHVQKSFLYELRASNDEICKRHGLEVVKQKEIAGEVRAGDMKKYQILKKGFEGTEKSYVLDTAAAVKISLAVASDKNEFIKCMNHQGFRVSWTNTRKHITFTDSEGKKVRLSNLQKTFSDEGFTREGLEREFKRVFTKRLSECTREVAPVKSDIKGGAGECTVKRVSDRVFDVVRELERELRKYSPTGRDAIRSEQQESKRIDREQPVLTKIDAGQTKRIEPTHEKGISL